MLYWTDVESQLIRVSTLDGSNPRTLISRDIGMAGNNVEILDIHTTLTMSCIILEADPHIVCMFVCTTVYISSSPILFLEAIAVDWITGQLYWTDALLRSIAVYDTSTELRRSLISTGNNTSPRAIVVDPNTR